MTSKEKAEELVHKYRMLLMDIGDDYGQEVLLTILSRTSALIAVDEILNHHSQEQSLYRIDKYYWQQVKQEIENL
jgi:hypothetical protein